MNDSDPDNLLVHHFSIGSKASRLAYALPDRMLLIYHNVTPPEFFFGFYPALARHCYLGRRELRAYAGRCVLALGDSEYNRRELETAGFHRTAVLPPISGFSHLDVEPDPLVAEMFDDGWTNILFVGRIAPNKKFEDLIRFFHAYQTRFNPRSRLLLVGSHEGFDAYVDTLGRLLERLGQHHVVFAGRVSSAALTAYYDVADLFLCASEHEGFCVPIVEAFYKRVPVIAFAAAAVPSTMDGAGVLYDSKDPVLVAALMNAVLSDTAQEDRIVSGQLEALARLRTSDFDGRLLTLVREAFVAPRAVRAPAARDLRAQLDRADRLEPPTVRRPSPARALADRRR